jgi:Domain of Unknown Function (DUF1080)
MRNRLVLTTVATFCLMIGIAQKMDNILSKKEIKAGWILLFDGSTNKGWRAFNKTTFPTGWVIEDGTLKGLGTAHGDTGGDIVFGDAMFENFELSIDWKVSPGGNSGIFYHVVEGKQYAAPYANAPEYQLIDDIGYPGKLEEWQKCAADYAMYNAPSDKALKPAGEWNNSRIIFTKEKVEYWLNGKMTVSFVPWSDDWTKRRNSGKWEAYPDYGKATTGLIALQDHGSPTWFKNMKIRKL